MNEDMILEGLSAGYVSNDSGYDLYNQGFSYAILPLAFNLQQDTKPPTKVDKTYKHFAGEKVKGVCVYDNKDHQGTIVYLTYNLDSKVEYVYIIDHKTNHMLPLYPDKVRTILPEKIDNRNMDYFLNNLNLIHRINEEYVNKFKRKAVSTLSFDKVKELLVEQMLLSLRGEAEKLTSIEIKMIYGCYHIPEEELSEDNIGFFLWSIISLSMKVYGNNCDLNWIDMSKVTFLDGLFLSVPNFNGYIDLWDVSNVKSMVDLFDCSSFNHDISNWNVKNVENMACMFLHSAFNLDISRWNVLNVLNALYMFSDSKFNLSIKDWKLTSIKNAKCMFQGSNLQVDDLPSIKYFPKEFLENKVFNVQLYLYNDEANEENLYPYTKELIQEKFIDNRDFENEELPMYAIINLAYYLECKTGYEKQENKDKLNIDFDLDVLPKPNKDNKLKSEINFDDKFKD